MSPELTAEVDRRFAGALKANGFRLVLKYGGNAYWKHKDGRSICVGPDYRGELAALSLADTKIADRVQDGRKRRGL